MLSSESGLVETTLLLLLSEHDCVMLLLWQAVQSALHLQNTKLLNLMPVHMVSVSFRLLQVCYLCTKISEFQSGATYPFGLHWLSSSSLSELMVITLTGLGESAITMVCRVSPDLGTLLLLPPPIQSCCC